MRAFGLSKDLCVEFLRKQSIIANLKEGRILLGFVASTCTLFLQLKDRIFSFQNNPKHLDHSYKMNLDLWDCLGKVNLVS